jgi:hypothetical protein
MATLKSQKMVSMRDTKTPLAKSVMDKPLKNGNGNGNGNGKKGGPADPKLKQSKKGTVNIYGKDGKFMKEMSLKAFRDLDKATTKKTGNPASTYMRKVKGGVQYTKKLN